jgi:hypothetical protein
VTPRVRRLLAIGAVIILLLFTGRWTVDVMAARWWALSVSPLAGAFVTRWILLGLALDFTAIIAASAWFATQAILVARVIATVKVQRDDGPHRVLEPVAGSDHRGRGEGMAGAVGSGLAGGQLRCQRSAAGP